MISGRLNLFPYCLNGDLFIAFKLVEGSGWCLISFKGIISDKWGCVIYMDLGSFMVEKLLEFSSSLTNDFVWLFLEHKCSKCSSTYIPLALHIQHITIIPMTITVIIIDRKIFSQIGICQGYSLSICDKIKLSFSRLMFLSLVSLVLVCLTNLQIFFSGVYILLL